MDYPVDWHRRERGKKNRFARPSPRFWTLNIIAVDWGKEAGKRSAYRADLPSRVISRSGFDGTLEHLLDYAASLTSPVLIGIDAAIGFPAAAWQRLGYQPGPGSVTFIDYLLDPSLPADLFEAVSGPEE